MGKSRILREARLVVHGLRDEDSEKLMARLKSCPNIKPE